MAKSSSSADRISCWLVFQYFSGFFARSAGSTRIATFITASSGVTGKLVNTAQWSAV